MIVLRKRAATKATPIHRAAAKMRGIAANLVQHSNGGSRNRLDPEGR